MRFAQTILFSVLSLILVACGGSGGGATPPGPPPPGQALDNATFQGTYVLSWMLGAEPGSAISVFGFANADGAGVLQSNGGLNQNGTVNVSNGQLSYAVASDGQIEFSIGGVVSSRGGISADGDRVVAHSVAPQFPGILIFLRVTGAYSPADLAGPNQLVVFDVVPSASYTSTRYDGTFDGTSMWSGPSAYNTQGTLGINLASPAGTYAVNATGGATYQVGTQIYTGQLVAGGEYGVMAGNINGGSGSLPSIAAIARRGASLSSATLTGDYWYATLEYSVAGSTTIGSGGSATSDGAGALTLVGTSNTAGVAGAVNTTASYNVGSGGSLTVDRGGAADGLLGQVASSGDFAVVGGGTQNMSNTVFSVMIRK